MYKNIISNYIGKLWGIISVFIFIPFYIKILGIEAYAIINFYTVILTILYFADGGLSATLNREIARTDDKQYLGNMLFTIERMYLTICVFIIVFVSSFSGLIAKNWLNSQTIPVSDLRIYIVLMGICVAFQLFTTLENSGLMGLEKQVLANGIQVSSSIVRSALVIIPLYFYPTLLTFFIWQLVSNIVFFFIARYNLWKYIKTDYEVSFDKNILKTLGNFALGMMLMAAISSLNTQIDKLVISKLLSLKEFGYYSLAGILAQVPVLIITPIAVAILPKMVKFSELKEKENLTKLFQLNSFLISALALSGTLVLLLFTKDFILIWTNDFEIANVIEKVSKILIIGSLFLSFQFMPYYLAIANGHTKTNIKLSSVLLILIVPVLYYLVDANGIVGAAYSWLIFNFISCFYLGYFLIRKFLNKEFKKWLIFDIILPTTVTFMFGVLAFFVTKNLPKGLYTLFYSVVIGLISLSLNIFIFLKIHSKYNLVDFIGLKNN